MAFEQDSFYFQEIRMKAFALTVFLLYLHDTFAATPKPFTTCSRRWKKIGCFHDSLSPRPLPELLLNDRDMYSSANDGHVLNWYKWKESQHSLACRCAEKARAKGYRVFGLQFYGECWGGQYGDQLFSKDGPSNNCIQQLTTPYACVKQDPFTECVGGESTNFIYLLTDNTPAPQSPDVDGGYSKWSDWTACSKSCGEGKKMRERTCSNPSPKGNGKRCESLGPSVEEAKCHEKSCEQKCFRAMDIGIVVDSSASVRRLNFEKVKESLVNLVKEFDINESGTHIGIIRYNHRATLQWNFAQNRNLEALIKAIRGIKYKSGGTRTDLAMELAGNGLFKGPGARSSVPHILVVLTDGKTNSGSTPYKEVLDHLKKLVPDIKVIAVGIGPKIERSELLEIADYKEENLNQFEFENLSKRLKGIVKEFCQRRF